MNAGTQQILQEAEPAPERNVSNDDLRTNKAAREIAARVNGSAVVDRKPRVFVAADKRLLREAISRMLVKSGEIEIAGPDFVEPFRAEDLLRVLSSRGNANGDLAAVRMARTTAPRVQILLIGDGRRVRVSAVRAGGSEREFAARRFGQRRVGRSASTASWRSSLPGRTLRNLVPVFGETSNFLSFRDRTPEDGMTRREQQLMPLIAEGLTNKEIANHFCLSEQTVKNHLYRMRHKIGATDRLGIVQVCHTQGFMPEFSVRSF